MPALPAATTRSMSSASDSLRCRSVDALVLIFENIGMLLITGLQYSNFLASEYQTTVASQSVSEATTLQIKMIVGQWYTDEFGNQTRMIYNAKEPRAFEAP
jgi:hypothetical protein